MNSVCEGCTNAAAIGGTRFESTGLSIGCHAAASEISASVIRWREWYRSRKEGPLLLHEDCPGRVNRDEAEQLYRARAALDQLRRALNRI